MRRRLWSRRYQWHQQVVDDLRLVWSNAMAFNQVYSSSFALVFESRCVPHVLYVLYATYVMYVVYVLYAMFVLSVLCVMYLLYALYVLYVLPIM